MTRRLRVELAEVAAQPNLEAALWAAARGKRARPDVAAFLADAPRRLARVRDALLAARLPAGRLHAFAIRDPKPRIIHAAPFADRVAQHALVRLLEPRLEQALVPTSFACRPGRGVHAALLHAQACCRPERWTLKLDVLHCFPAISHERLLALLHRRFKGSAMALVEHIVRSHASRPGYGLPIGALTSQHFANQFLGEIDRHARARPECLAHVRYMDDIVLWCSGRDAAQALHRSVEAFTRERLGLALKPPLVQDGRHVFGFCGMRVGPRGLRLGARRRRAWRAQWRVLRDGWRAGRLDEAALQRGCNVLRALSHPAPAAAWQRAVLGADFDL